MTDISLKENLKVGDEVVVKEAAIIYLPEEFIGNTVVVTSIVNNGIKFKGEDGRYWYIMNCDMRKITKLEKAMK